MKVQAKKALMTAAGIAFATSLLAPQAALAQDMGWYAGAGVGQAKARDFCDEVGGPGVSCDDKDTSFKLFGGYQINRNFAVEGAYVDLGEAVASAGGNFLKGETQTWQLVAVGIMPLQNNFSVFGKAGLHRWDVDASAALVGVGSGSVSDNGTDFTFGFGAGYEFTRNIGVRLEWERFKSVGDVNTTGVKSDVDLVSVGLRYRF